MNSPAPAPPASALLSLPDELLKLIALDVADALADLKGTSRFRRRLLSFAATCRRLYAITLPFVWSCLRLDSPLGSIGSLLQVLSKHAPHVRAIAVVFATWPPDDVLDLLGRCLRLCSRCTELCMTALRLVPDSFLTILQGFVDSLPNSVPQIKVLDFALGGYLAVLAPSVAITARRLDNLEALVIDGEAAAAGPDLANTCNSLTGLRSLHLRFPMQSSIISRPAGQSAPLTSLTLTYAQVTLADLYATLMACAGSLTALQLDIAAMSTDKPAPGSIMFPKLLYLHLKKTTSRPVLVALVDPNSTLRHLDFSTDTEEDAYDDGQLFDDLRTFSAAQWPRSIQSVRIYISRPRDSTNWSRSSGIGKRFVVPTTEGRRRGQLEGVEVRVERVELPQLPSWTAFWARWQGQLPETV